MLGSCKISNSCASRLLMTFKRSHDSSKTSASTASVSGDFGSGESGSTMDTTCGSARTSGHCGTYVRFSAGAILRRSVDPTLLFLANLALYRCGASSPPACSGGAANPLRGGFPSSKKPPSKNRTKIPKKKLRKPLPRHLRKMRPARWRGTGPLKCRVVDATTQEKFGKNLPNSTATNMRGIW